MEKLSKNLQKDLQLVANKLNSSLLANKVLVTYNKRNGIVEDDQFWLEYLKFIMEKVDLLLAQHYGFTEEEFDYIINYDIKYRMEKELNNGE